MERPVAEAVLKAYAAHGPKLSTDTARPILRAWLAARGMTEDRYGNFKDTERTRVHFSGTKIYDQGKNANGDWVTRKSWSLIDAATMTVAHAAETTGDTGLAEKLRGKKKQRVEQRKSQASKREQDRADEALQNQALVVASQEMPEQFVEAVVDGVSVPELDTRVAELRRKFAWLREQGQPVTADQFMSVDEPPIAPLFIDVALVWTETVDGHPYTVQLVHAHGRERTAKVQIGLSDDSALALEVDPFSHGVSMTMPPRDRQGDAYMSGWLSWTDRGPQAGMFFLASHEKQKGAGGRVLDLWCRMLDAYGVTTWKAEAVGDEGRAFLAAKVKAGRLRYVDEVGATIFVQCINDDPRQGRLALNARQPL